MNVIESLKVVSLDLGKHEHINLYGFGDLHNGNPYSNLKAANARIKEIQQDPDGYAILNGDLGEFTAEGGVRSTYDQSVTPQMQIVDIAEMLRPIANKIVGATEGNHEKSLTKKTSILPTEQALARIGVDTNKIYSPDAVLMFLTYETLRGTRVTFSVYFMHGKGGGGTIGGKANKMVKMQAQVIADVYIMGHDHEQMGFPRGIYIADTHKKRIIFQKSLFVNSGAFLEWGGYAIGGLYTPAITGAPIIKLWVERHQEGKLDNLIKRKEVPIRA